jgi:hypothetical protein
MVRDISTGNSLEPSSGFDPGDPAGSLRRWRVELRAHVGPLILRQKRLLGAWDPLLRQIDVYDCVSDRSDESLVRTLGHEIWHAGGGTFGPAPRGPHDNSEAAAERFARAWVDGLGPAGVRRCAAALRALASRTAAKPADPPPAIESIAANPLNIGS